MKTQTKNSLLLLLCAFIWGTPSWPRAPAPAWEPIAFWPGAAGWRCWCCCPRSRCLTALHRSTGTDGWPENPCRAQLPAQGGLVCGTLLFVASAAQQIGMTFNPSTAKAGFLTAMYVVLVPVFGLALGRRGSAQLWLSMVIAVCGLYLLCMKNGFGGMEPATGPAAVRRAVQLPDHGGGPLWSPQVDGVRLSLRQFFVVAVESTVAALLLETPGPGGICRERAAPAYCGVMSSGVAYTLQILGQRDMNPAIASLIMCLESVFSALGGWLLLHQSLSLREVFGCVLIFAAVVLAQLPLEARAEPEMAQQKAGSPAAHAPAASSTS